MGKILLHRFYMKKSFKKAEYHEVAATILFIAGKLGSGGNFVSIEKVIHFIVRDCCKDPVKRSCLNTKEGSKVCFPDCGFNVNTCYFTGLQLLVYCHFSL